MMDPGLDSATRLTLDPGMKTLITSFLLLLTPALAHSEVVTEKLFRDRVVGQPITLGPDVVFTINADNTIDGTVQGTPATGTWAFEDGFWCRTITVGEVFTEDCQLWRIDGTDLVITRDRGRGESFRYERQP